MNDKVNALAVLDDVEQKLRLAGLSYEQTIPLRSTRTAVAELIEADREYDAAREALFAAKKERGSWHVNPLGHNHPAVVRMRAAQERRAVALAGFAP